MVLGEIIDPKVYAPFTTPPGQIPRRVLMERKRRLYLSQNIDSLLKERAVFHNIPNNDELVTFIPDDEDLSSSSVLARFLKHHPSVKHYLPLHIFDDLSYEERPPSEYAELQLKDKEGKPYLPVKALRYNTTSSLYEWAQGRVYSIPEDFSKFSVFFPDTSSTEDFHRLFVWVIGENPFLFCDRIAQAYALRNHSEAVIRYKLYVENMPVDDFTTEPFLFKKPILAALHRHDTNSPLVEPVLNECMEEVKLEYARSINKQLFDISRSDPSLSYLFANSDPLPDPSEPEPIPEHGCVLLPKYSFDDLAGQFKYHTFLTQNQVVASVLLTITECTKVLKQSLFTYSISRPLAVEGFLQTQEAAKNNAVKYVKDVWAMNVRTGIRNNLLQVKQGWYSLQSLSVDIYKISRLKRFLTMIRLRMQDNIRFLVENSLERYVAWLSKAMSPSILINSPSDIIILDPVTMDSLLGQLFPIFTLDLSINESNGCVAYMTPVSKLLEVPLAVFDSAVQSMMSVPMIENDVLGGLFKYGSDRVPCLNAPLLNDKAVAQFRASLEKSLSHGLIPLDEYLQVYSSYSEFIRLNPEDFVVDLEVRCGIRPPEVDPDAEAPADTGNEPGVIDRSIIVQEVQKHFLAAEDVLNQICPSVQVGSFLVNCVPVRKYLAEKHKRLATLALGLLNSSGKAIANEICTEFKEVYNKLSKPPRNVEQLTELRSFTEETKKKLPLLQKKVSDMSLFYDSLESFNFVVSDNDFTQRWSAVSWPHDIEDLMSNNIPAFENFENQFKEELDQGKAAFSRHLQSLAVSVASFVSKTDISQVESVAAEVKSLQRQLKQAEEKVGEFNTREGLFGVDQSEYQELSSTVKNFAPYSELWLSTYDWVNGKSIWMNDSWMSLDGEAMEKTVGNLFRVINKTVRSLKDVPDCQKIALQVKEEIEEFQPHVPLIVALRSPGMRDRHWEEISEVLGFPLNPDEEFTLTKLFELDIPKHTEAILKVTAKAQKEYAIERSLDQMVSEWKGIEFFIKDYAATKTYIMGGAEDIMQQLDDHIVMTQSMSFSPFKGPFEDRIANWESLLKTVQLIIEEWVEVQTGWMYLEPIFSSPDIIKQLPQEYKRFQTVDLTWRKLLGEAHKNPDVLSYCQGSDLLKKFKDSNVLLSQVQKGLSQYLESKRAVFARFYFLSDDDLLKILSQTKDPTAVQPHLKKCYENIHKLRFEGSDNLMTAMFSAENECIEFVSPIKPTLLVENWMCDIENMMRSSVRNQIEIALKSYFELPRTEWVRKFAGQVVLAVDMIVWTMEVEDAIEKNELPQLLEKLGKQLTDITFLVRGDLSVLDTLTLGALITLDVHARDVVKNLIECDVSNKGDFEWLSQLRYYWRPDDKDKDNVFVEIVQTVAPYCYEYLGNTARLVITPLTNKIYMTLMGAIALHMGGAPAGPAGTGKTETTKDLAKALANQCVVFNCSDGLNYLAMEKFFKGLAMAGAWACFDEFNRIDIEVLSVIAQQLSTIYTAVKERQARFVFGGTDIPLNPNFACFITMNPGYAGRTELPDNLKVLFRPVACMVPDYALIAQIRLFSFGFTQSQSLSTKMVSTFKLSSEQLSSQYHYDFGMRAVNTVISAAGNLRRQDLEMSEEHVLLRALTDCNVPKFLADDIPLFKGIISDLFPGVKPVEVDYGPLLVAIKESITDLNLQPNEGFITKVIQLWETIILRHGLMLVGPTAGGKSCCYKVLQCALGKLAGTDDKYQKTKTHVLNPKSITSEQLYGGRDKNTQEWFDGVLANCIRKAAEDTSPDYNWIICDGPVDAVWIENMNTVLDDNKKLCLNSGEIIPLTPQMRIMFEVEDLAQASPATVSRCGMVYLDPKSTVPIEVLFQSWLNTLPENCMQFKERVSELCNSVLDPTLVFVKKQCIELVPAVTSNLIQSCFRIFDAFLQKYQPLDELNPVPVEDLERLPSVIDSIFIFSCVWSLGATIIDKSQPKLDSFLRECISTHSIKADVPTEGTIFEYLFDDEQNQWVTWLSTVPPFEIPEKARFSEMIVPTPESIGYQYLIKILASNGSHVLCSGDTGTGKTVQITDLLSNQMETKFTPSFMNFSAQTSANMTQDIIDSKIERRRAVYYGPPLGTKMVVFIDDLNMPKLEKYGAQPPIELIRQFMDYGGWYDRKDLYMRYLVDVQFITAMGPPGGGRNPVTNRLLRHFNILNFVDLSSKSLNQIFNKIVGWYLDKPDFSDELRSLRDSVVSATVDLYHDVSSSLLPTPARSHYTFNLRDLSKVIQGMLMADPKALESKNSLIRLWAHECQRVFMDRLINDEDRTAFSEIVYKTVQNQFDINFDDVATSSRLIYGDFLGSGSEPRKYKEIQSVPTLIKRVRDYLEDYNLVSQQAMNLVMFQNAVEHVTRIVRVLRQPYGNLLLLGVGGSGRQSLTRLASFICEYNVIQIEIAKGYGIDQFREDLKKVLFECGLELKSTVFLFTDAQIVVEEFLEDINNILNSGDVPNIFDINELETIYQAMLPVCQAKKIIPNKLNLYAAFKSRVRENIHVVLCMSPMGEAFRSRLRMFPSLVNCCTIDWFTEWPGEALESVAASVFSESKLIGRPKNCTPEQANEIEANEVILRQGVVKMCVAIHQTVEKMSIRYREELRRYNYVTPTSYLEVLSTFNDLLKEKGTEIRQGKSRLLVGINTIIRTSAEVDVLRDELEKLVPQLKKQSAETDEMITQINKDNEAAAITRAAVAEEEAEAAAKAEEVRSVKESAEEDLAEAIPILESARESVQCLKIKSIQEVANYKSPPAGVKLVMQAICVMLGIRPNRINDPSGVPGKKIDDFWTPSKSLLSNAKGLMDSLLEYNAEEIAPSTIKAITPFIDDPGFNPETIQKVSEACKSMCQWVIACYKYNTVFKTVEPKRIKLAEAKAELAVTEKALAAKKAELQEVEESIAKLQRLLDEKLKVKEALQTNVESSQIKMARATKLLDSLGSEKERWEATVKDFDEQETNLVGDVMLSAGYVAYLGAFTAEFRESMANSWKESLREYQIPYSSNYTLITTLGDPVQIRSWLVDGLPTDNLSIENAIIMSKAKRWPVMIDPQGQANRWIRNAYKDIGFDIVKLSDRDFNRKLENGVRFGRAILLENVGEDFPPSLEPLLLRSTFKEGGTEMIKLGDQTIAYHSDFRLFITSKMPNPHYAPETSVKVTLLNFTITMGGLEDQLLSKLVIEEKPELEQMRAKLIKDNAQMAKELRTIEDDMLKVLVETPQEELLESDEAINILSNSKEVASKIKEKVAEAAITEKEINNTRLEYLPVADLCATLYFCVIDISNIDPMYQYSLQWFMNLFVKGIHSAEKDDDIKQRLQNLNDYLTYSLYENICRSLFERHKLLFSFLMTIRIEQKAGNINPMEWRFLISGGSLTSMPLECPGGWVTKEMWAEICNLGELETFKNFAQSLLDNLSDWQRVFDSNDAHKEPLPEPYSGLDCFKRLLIMRCIRSDKVVEAVQEYVTAILGRKYIIPPTFDLASSFRDSSALSPLIFVLSAGADPAGDLFDFADKMRMRSKLANVSLGQGQGDKAAELIQAAASQGHWVLLQNCHLASSWMSTLEAIVEQMDPDKVRPEFRLWLTSMPSKAFPVTILQNGVKMTNEPPMGLRANLLRSWSNYDDTFLEHPTNPNEFRKQLFGLSLFHATVTERRKFGALGFNIPYEIAPGDLSVCVRQLHIFLEKYREVPFKVLKFLTAQINYGGRITDGLDKRTINTLIEDFVNDGVLQEGYKFSSDGEFRTIDANTNEEYCDYLRNLGLNTSPEVFGLHSNAAITCAQNETFAMFEQLLLMQPRATGAVKGLSREEVIETTTRTILSELHDVYDLESITEKYPVLYEESMNTVLIQEVIRYNRMLQVMKNSLSDLLKALKGEVVLSAQLEEMSSSIFNNQVPSLWAAVAYPSLKPLMSWIVDLKNRLLFIDNWVENGIPNVFHISSFFFPQAFLTGTLQNYARKHVVSIDTVSFAFNVLEKKPHEITEKPEDGCYIYGLFLEGAGWSAEEHSLVESSPKELFTEFPVLHLCPVPNRPKPETGIYDCPMYKTLARAGTLSTTGHSTNYVVSVEIPSKEDQSHWIKRGVALFCALKF
ncbi:hypothetical protein GEMRC1_002362 [Eukaryota sp. GEM-RC1]